MKVVHSWVASISAMSVRSKSLIKEIVTQKHGYVLRPNTISFVLKTEILMSFLLAAVTL
jgi:hypothetical protein